MGAVSSTGAVGSAAAGSAAGAGLSSAAGSVVSTAWMGTTSSGTGAGAVAGARRTNPSSPPWSRTATPEAARRSPRGGGTGASCGAGDGEASSRIFGNAATVHRGAAAAAGSASAIRETREMPAAVTRPMMRSTSP